MVKSSNSNSHILPIFSLQLLVYLLMSESSLYIRVISHFVCFFPNGEKLVINIWLQGQPVLGSRLDFVTPSLWHLDEGHTHPLCASVSPCVRWNNKSASLMMMMGWSPSFPCRAEAARLRNHLERMTLRPSSS